MTNAVNDPVELSIRQFIEAWRVMCGGARTYAQHAEAGIEYIFSGVPIPFFNVAVVTGRDISPATLKTYAERACEWASTQSVPWLFVATREALEAGTDAAAAVDDCGLAPMMRLTGMIAHRVLPPSGIPAALELTRPQDDIGCSALLDVNGLAYGMDLDLGRELIGKAAFWADHVPVVGLVGDKPVCCTGVMQVEGYRYVALVATDPSHQRRGYAEAAMRHALDLSRRKHGDLPTTLHATEAGRPIYERMGYAPISDHSVFMEKKFLSGH